MSTLKILCYGDSNTWGQVAFEERQIPEQERWTTLLGEQLGAEVIPAGQCSRIAGDYDTDEPERNGRDPFLATLKNCLPLDIVVIALGTNDLKKRYQRTAQQIVDDLLWYRDTATSVCEERGYPVPNFVFQLPPNFNSPKDYFDADDSVRLAVNEQMSRRAEVVMINDLELSEDGVHISINDHKRIADELTTKIKEIA